MMNTSNPYETPRDVSEPDRKLELPGSERSILVFKWAFAATMYGAIGLLLVYRGIPASIMIGSILSVIAAISLFKAVQESQNRGR